MLPPSFDPFWPFVSFFPLFPLLDRLCTKYEKHREGKKKPNKTARGQTWTGSLRGVGGRGGVFSVYSSVSPTIYVQFWSGGGGRVRLDDGSINLIKARANWRGRSAEGYHVVWCPAWQLKARVRSSRVLGRRMQCSKVRDLLIFFCFSTIRRRPACGLDFPERAKPRRDGFTPRQTFLRLPVPLGGPELKNF